MAIAASIDHDQAIIQSVFVKLDRPKGVSLPKLEFGEDHTSDPAVWLTFSVDTSTPLTDHRAKELAEFSQSVSRTLYDEQIARIPYVRFSEVTRRGSAR